MEGFVKGDIIVIDFPYSDMIHFKKRPAIVIKVPKGEDIISLQITGYSYEKSIEIPLKNEDFKQGSLKRDSYIRLDKIFENDDNGGSERLSSSIILPPGFLSIVNSNKELQSVP